MKRDIVFAASLYL